MTKTEMSVAINEMVKRDGQWTEQAVWVRVAAWGKLAESCAKHLQKGRKILVEGRLAERKWEKDGQKRSLMEVVASDVRFLDAPKEHPSSPDKGRGDGPPPDEDQDVPF